MTDWPLFIVECFVALGTLGLAWFTMRLARSTSMDVEAQWRPLLVPCQLETWDQGIPTQVGWAALGGGGAFYFAFKNIGKGAALSMGGEIRAVSIVGLELLLNPVLGVNEQTAFHGGPINELDDNRVRVRIDYSDLAGNRHRTDATYRRINSNLSWQVEKVTPQPTEYLSPATVWRRRTSLGWRNPFLAVKRWWLRNPPY